MTIEIQKGVKVGFEDLVEGISQMDTSSLEKFSEAVQQLIRKRKTPNQTARELALIKIIYSKLPSATQKRYDSLYKKLQDETICEEEHQELLMLIERAEQHNVKWLEALIELAQLRAVSVQKVKKQLGIEKYPLVK